MMTVDRRFQLIIAFICVACMLLAVGCGEDKSGAGDPASAGSDPHGSGTKEDSGSASISEQKPVSPADGTRTGSGTEVSEPAVTTTEPESVPKAGITPPPAHSWDVPRSEMVLKLGRNPFLQTRLMLRVHEPLLDYMAKKLGVKAVKLVLAEDYAGIVNYLKDGKIDIAWIGTVAYIDGREKAGARPIVRPVRFGRDTYGSIIIVRTDSPFKTVTDLKGKSFAFVDRESASGYLFPLAYLLSQGITPNRDFKKVDYLREHDSVVMAVFFKKFTAGAVYDDARDKLGQENKEHLRVLARIPSIPNEPIVVHPEMPADLVNDIKQAFLDLSKEKDFLKDFNSRINDKIDSFVEAKDEEYNSVRELLKNLEEKTQ